MQWAGLAAAPASRLDLLAGDFGWPRPHCLHPDWTDSGISSKRFEEPRAIVLTRISSSFLVRTQIGVVHTADQVTELLRPFDEQVILHSPSRNFR